MARTPTIRSLRGWLLRRTQLSGAGNAGPLFVDSNVEIKLRQRGSLAIGQNGNLERGVLIDTQNGSITIGDQCGLNPNVILYGCGNIEIGNDVRIAANTVIVSANHVFADPVKPIRKQGIIGNGITIEDDVWIGANCTILDGSHIAKGCVIGAGSVVRGRTDPYGIYAGVPIRKIRSRS